MNDILIRLMQPKDVKTVVDIHLDSFENFFLSSLGSRFLLLLYNTILEDESGISIVCETEGKVSGFAVGSNLPSGFYKRLISKKIFLFGLAALPAAIKSPGILPRLFRSLQVPQQYQKPDRQANLMSLAVSPTAQKQGIGGALIKEFATQCSQRKVDIINLTTDAQDNDKVNNFYQNFGFVLSNEFTTAEGRKMNEYQLSVKKAL
jgi:ribosomal protein S18 acetylase RimI-like enzyme